MSTVVTESVPKSEITRPEPSLGGHEARKRRYFWPFVGPAFLLYALFLLVPTVATVVLSFTAWSGAGDTPTFNGFTQYQEMFTSPSFQHAFVNTLLYIVVGGIATFVLAFLFTIVLRDMGGGKLIRTILFFPNIVAPVALGMFLGFVFKYQPNKQGLANYLIEHLGGPAQLFLKPSNVTWIVIGAMVWAGIGFFVTILMSAMEQIPEYLYEDAEIAGASAWQKFRNITLPLTWDVIGIAGVLWTISAVKVFELVFVLAGPGTYSPPIQTWTLGIYVFDRSFGTQGSPQYGTACAGAVVMIVMVVVLVSLLRRVMRRDRIQY